MSDGGRRAAHGLDDRQRAEVAGRRVLQPQREHLLARDLGHQRRRYQFGDVFGGGISGSGVRATSSEGSRSATCSASAAPKSSSSPSTVCARTPKLPAKAAKSGVTRSTP